MENVSKEEVKKLIDTIDNPRVLQYLYQFIEMFNNKHKAIPDQNKQKTLVS